MISGPFIAHLKPTVTISVPKRVVLKRGPHTDRVGSPVTSIRLGIQELEDVDKVCELLEMDRTNFIRWCSHEVALDILRQKAMYDRNNK